MKHIIIISILYITLLSACKDSPCLKGSGNNTSDNRELSDDITMIQLYDNLSVDIHIAQSNSVELTGGENVLPYIETKLENGILQIRNNNKCGFLRGFDHEVKMDLYIKSFNTIEYYGSKNIVMKDTLFTDYFRFVSEQGTGSVKLLIESSKYTEIQLLDGLVDVELNGSSPGAGYYCDGSAWINARNFQNKDASIYNRSTGDCIVNADSLLSYSIINLGNIQYIGNPTLERKKKTGKGRLIHID